MMYKLGPTSRKRLIGLKPALIAIVERAIELSKIDFAVIEGLRTAARQEELYAKGRTTPGPKVTWTLWSKHLLGDAVDLAPFIDGKIDWTPGDNFDLIAIAMYAAAEELETRVRWGADWDQDGIPRERGETDSPHWELP